MKPARSILPPTAVLELTYRCNHACLFCSCPWFAHNPALKPEPEMETQSWFDVISEFAQNGVVHFGITGGEALLRNDWREILKFTAGQTVYEMVSHEDGTVREETRKASVNFLSNGRELPDELLELCAEHKVHLSLSLPGLSTYTRHVGADTAPEAVLEGFRRAKVLGVTTTAGITVTALNFQELPRTLTAALSAGADSILLNRFLPGGRGLAHPELALTALQVAQMVQTVESLLRKAGRNGSIGTEYPRCLVPEHDTLKRLSVGTTCGAAKGFLVVGPNGKLRVCNHSDVELLHWRDWRGLKEHPYWRRFLFSEFIPDACQGCDELQHCDGGCPEAARLFAGKLEHGAPDPLLVNFVES